MKLITETTENIRYITEDKEDGKKSHFIEGIFMQAETKNRNGRVYPAFFLATIAHTLFPNDFHMFPGNHKGSMFPESGNTMLYNVLCAKCFRQCAAGSP